MYTVISHYLLYRKSRGFGFVTFEQASSVELVLQVNVHIIDNRKVIHQAYINECFKKMT